MKITRAAAALALAAALVVGVPATASEAASRPTRADRHAMVEANHACTAAPDESTYENCVVGAFVQARHRYIDERFYVADYSDADPTVYSEPEGTGPVPCTCVRLTRASKKI